LEEQSRLNGNPEVARRLPDVWMQDSKREEVLSQVKGLAFQVELY
jgi:hypothetical protein